MSILQIWVTWASKITFKNLQLCSIKIKGSHAPWKPSIQALWVPICFAHMILYTVTVVRTNWMVGRPGNEDKYCSLTFSTATSNSTFRWIKALAHLFAPAYLITYWLADSATPTQYASVTRLPPAFRVRVWLRETRKLLPTFVQRRTVPSFAVHQLDYFQQGESPL